MRGRLTMKKIILTLCAVLMVQNIMAQDTIWVKYDNRFKEHKNFVVANNDSIEFRS